MPKKSKLVGNAILVSLFLIGVVAAGMGFTGRAQQASNYIFGIPPTDSILGDSDYFSIDNVPSPSGSVALGSGLIYAGDSRNPGAEFYSVFVRTDESLPIGHYEAYYTVYDNNGAYYFTGIAVWDVTAPPTTPPTISPTSTPVPTNAPTATPTQAPTPTPIPQVYVTIGVSGQGTTTPAASTSGYAVTVGSNYQIFAQPNSGNSFSYWLLQDNSKIYTPSYTFTNIQSSKTALAIFTPIPSPTPLPTIPGITPSPSPYGVTPTATPQPTTEPTPLPIQESTPEPTITPVESTYVDVNEFAQVGGPALCFVTALGMLAYNKLWFFKK